MIYGNFKDAITESIRKLINRGHDVHPNNWQSMDVSQLDAAEMREILFHSFQVLLPDDPVGKFQILQADICPNLPWADHHFEYERVSRQPLNPGETWKYWPWAHSASTFKEEQFDHSYAERYWPRFAGYTKTGQLDHYDKSLFNERCGVRNRVGDLDDIIARLSNDPATRQAVLSVWHPEDQVDTGKRVPCSLTYQFIKRSDRLHCIYNIRSCDALRHFRDDIYLTCRLILWVLSELRQKDNSWDNVIPGFLQMNIGSFHCFKGDIPRLRQQVQS